MSVCFTCNITLPRRRGSHDTCPLDTRSIINHLSLPFVKIDVCPWEILEPKGLKLSILC